VPKSPDYDYQQSDYKVTKEKESTNKPYETEKAVRDAEASMAIKQERGWGAATRSGKK
jgi:hypothetical protein